MSEMSIQHLKRLLSDRLLEVVGVSGIGSSEGRLNVYLEDESTTTKKEVKKIVRSVAGDDAAVNFVVTGPFRATK